MKVLIDKPLGVSERKDKKQQKKKTQRWQDTGKRKATHLNPNP
jgi:hypothetical protein